MQDNINEIKTWLKDNGHKYAWLAEKCHVKTSAVTNWFSKGSIPKDKLALIELLMKPDNQEEYFTISLSEENAKIVTAFLEKYPDVDLAQYCEIQAMNFVKNLEREFDKYISPTPIPETTISKNPEGEVRLIPVELTEVPVVGQIAAGSLIHGDIDIQETLRVMHKVDKKCYALKVVGNSMEPVINNNEHVIVKPWPVENGIPPIGTIVAYHDGRGITLKILGYKDGQHVLSSYNPLYPDIIPLDGGSISATLIEVVR